MASLCRNGDVGTVIVPDGAGRPVAALAVDVSADAVRVLEQLRHRHVHVGVAVPSWLDELVADLRRAAALAELVAVTDVGHGSSLASTSGRMLTSRESAVLLRRSPETVRRWCRLGRLEGAVRTTSSEWFVPESAVLREVA
jgi:hypothetical protein